MRTKRKEETERRHKAACETYSNILTIPSLEELSFESSYRNIYNFTNSDGDEKVLASFLDDIYKSNGNIERKRWRFLKDISLYIIKYSRTGHIRRKLDYIIGIPDSMEFWLRRSKWGELPEEIIVRIANFF